MIEFIKDNGANGVVPGNWRTCIVIFMLVLGSCSNAEKKSPPIDTVIENALECATKQSLLMAKKYADQDTILPRSFINGEMTVSNSRWWTSGFFPGTLWYLYEYSKSDELLKYARRYTNRVEREKFTTDNHDVGFMLYCSFGNGLRLTGDSTYRDVLQTGAKSLSTRFNPRVGLIRSWDFNQHIWQYPVIIDNMMNLELLLWAANKSGNNYFTSIAISHADKTMEHHYRPDYSCYHVVSYDTITGVPHTKQTHQGYSDSSSWSRGQAWGLYGFTFMYRETKQKSYLERAQHIAAYILKHPNMPADGIPYWDFDAPKSSDEPRDASAASLIASALIELSGFVDKELSAEYISFAEKQLRSLASPEYTAKIGENGNFILMHSTGSKPHNSEVDVPLTYADYYYVEALLRFKKKLEQKI